MLKEFEYEIIRNEPDSEGSMLDENGIEKSNIEVKVKVPLYMVMEFLTLIYKYDHETHAGYPSEYILNDNDIDTIIRTSIGKKGYIFYKITEESNIRRLLFNRDKGYFEIIGPAVKNYNLDDNSDNLDDIDEMYIPSENIYDACWFLKDELTYRTNIYLEKQAQNSFIKFCEVNNIKY